MVEKNKIKKKQRERRNDEEKMEDLRVLVDFGFLRETYK